MPPGAAASSWPALSDRESSEAAPEADADVAICSLTPAIAPSQAPQAQGPAAWSRPCSQACAIPELLCKDLSQAPGDSSVGPEIWNEGSIAEITVLLTVFARRGERRAGAGSAGKNSAERRCVPLRVRLQGVCLA